MNDFSPEGVLSGAPRKCERRDIPSGWYTADYGGEDGKEMVRLWDITTQRLLLNLPGQGGNSGVRVSTQGQRDSRTFERGCYQHLAGPVLGRDRAA